MPSARGPRRARNLPSGALKKARTRPGRSRVCRYQYASSSSRPAFSNAQVEKVASWVSLKNGARPCGVMSQRVQLGCCRMNQIESSEPNGGGHQLLETFCIPVVQYTVM